MFDLFTITSGRTLYLNRLIRSISQQNHYLIKKHLIIFQNNSYEESAFLNVPSEYLAKIEVIAYPEKQSVGAVLNKYSSKLDAPLTMKLDDDALVRSQDFFAHAWQISQIIPNAVFSPFPVGLINNLGGVPSSERYVKYSEQTDTFYTLRKVNHVGGFARISDTSLLKRVEFSDSHNEDTEFSSFCSQNNIPMFYLDNCLIIEHQESTLGQHARYGETYFKGRF
mgnify:CR=1 FL=1